MHLSAIYLVVGILVILAAWIPLFLGRLPLSLPMIAVAIGALLGLTSSSGDPFGGSTQLARGVTEFALLVSVFGAGLKIDRRFSFAAWASTWRLLAVVMPLSIAGIAVAANALLGLPWGLAVLIGATLAPTDPVLASDYSSGPPGQGEEGETKFALTSEAGLNDGLAYPFVALGLLMLDRGEATQTLIGWAAIDLVWNIVGGTIVGVAFGYVMVRINDQLPQRRQIASSNSGIVSVGLAFVAFSAASFVGGNGFVAVFAEAVAMRNLVSGLEYSRRLDHAANQFERVAMMLVLAMLGVSLMRGLLHGVGWIDAVFVAVVLLIVRPVAVEAGFIGAREDRWTRAALGYFGIRGLASLYYAVTVAPQLSAPAAQRLTALVSLTVLASVVFYGMSAHVVASRLTGGEDEFQE